MKIKLLSTALALLSLATSYSQQFWVVTNKSSDLFTVSVSSGTIASSVTTSAINIAQNPIEGFQGMAQHPITGEVYVLFKDSDSNRYIGRLNTTNGEIITVAQTDSSLASIAFDASGVLYAMQGYSGGGNTQQMQTVDIYTTPETAFHTFTNTSGGDGDALVFNTTDNLMYRYDGDESGEFISLNLDTLAESVISTTSGLDSYGGALAYRQGQNKFLLGLGSTLYDLLADGTISTISSIAEFDSGTYNDGWSETYIKGLVNTPSSGEFWVVTNKSSDLFTVSVSSGTIASSVTTSAINIAQNPIEGFQGMAQHPITGEVYVLFKDSDSNRYIGRLNTTNGEIITVAQTDSSLASIAFDASGVLYAMQGYSGGGNTQQMQTVDIYTTPETAFHTFTNTSGGDGDALVFNTTDNLMYRYDGDESGEFISLNLDTLAESVISTTSGLDSYGGALAYRQGQNKFLLGLGSTLYDLLADGTISTISSIAEFDEGTYNDGWSETYIKGLVKVSSSTAGINDLAKTNISIYPNPTNNIINVNLGEVNSPTNYSIYSIDGKMIGDNNTVNNNSFSIDLTDMAIGIYILKIKSENSINTFKIIKN